MKKLILIFLLLLIPYSCTTLKQSNKYPINSAWLYYYNSKEDTTTVWIDRISILEGIIIRDTQFRNDTTIVGRVNRHYLYPIKNKE